MGFRAGMGMNTRELEELDLGIELAINNQAQAAHFIFSRLRENNSDSSQILALCAFTATDPNEAQAAFETALKLDPANPLLPQTRYWLENHNRLIPKTPVSSTIPAPVLMAGKTATAPLKESLSMLKPLPEAATPTVEATSKPARPVKIKDKPPFVPFSAVWWIRLVCSVVFFGAAMTLLYMFVTANNLTESEKAYFDRISQLNQETKDTNAQLQTAVVQFNAGKLEKSELEKHLSHVIGLDEEFMLLKSPSPRFDKLDGLLGEAYSYFNEGSVKLINGLEANAAGLISEGNRLFDLGNEYLRQARDELKALE